MSAVPVILFVYNRPRHLRQVIDALGMNTLASSTDLVIFSDGSRDSTDADAVKSVRSFIKTIRGFRSLTVVERQKNLGLSANIIGGITDVLRQHEECIVLEDDLMVAPYFLQYMNDGLQTYRHDDRVISIVGYIYPTTVLLPETFFLPYPDCWGWATWKRGWDIFRSDGAMLLKELRDRKLGRVFDVNGAYPFTKMLQGQVEGTNDSWAVRWRASALLSRKLSLYPGRSLVQNIGNDGSGRHSAPTTSFQVELSPDPVTVSRIDIETNPMALRAVESFWRWHYPHIAIRALRKAKRMLFR